MTPAAPTPAPSKLYGIDISHWNGAIDWTKIGGQGISFIYVKATQGDRYVDPKFGDNWNGLNTQATSILRGAYHFLVPEAAAAAGSTDTSSPGVKQAQNYLKHVAPLAMSDLPPCLDMEWYLMKDPATGYPKTDAQGQPLDFWANYTTAEIVAIAKDWLTTIEAQTGKKPIIYTSANWWKQRIGDDTTLSGYKFWVADYGAKSLADEQPRSPASSVSPLWQFTENGSVTNANQRGVDVDVYHGSENQFRTDLGLPANP